MLSRISPPMPVTPSRLALLSLFPQRNAIEAATRASEGRQRMKVIHGSLRGLLQEVKDKKVETVRVAGFMQSDVVPNGLPRYTAWVVVTALLDWDHWTEWRLLVGRGHAEVTENGATGPPRDAGRMAERGPGVPERRA